MHKLILAAPVAALALLAGCNSQPTTLTNGGPSDPTANEIAAAPPVKLPPALLASKTYRCSKDNSVVYVDFFNDSTTANLRLKKDATPTHLEAPAAGQAYAGEGYTVKGAAADKSVEITLPGKAAQSCAA